MTQTELPTEPPWCIDGDANDAICAAERAYGRELLHKALAHARSVGRKYDEGGPLIALVDVEAVLRATAPSAGEWQSKRPCKDCGTSKIGANIDCPYCNSFRQGRVIKRLESELAAMTKCKNEAKEAGNG